MCTLYVYVHVYEPELALNNYMYMYMHTCNIGMNVHVMHIRFFVCKHMNPHAILIHMHIYVHTLFIVSDVCH